MMLKHLTKLQNAQRNEINQEDPMSAEQGDKRDAQIREIKRMQEQGTISAKEAEKLIRALGESYAKEKEET